MSSESFPNTRAAYLPRYLPWLRTTGGPIALPVAWTAIAVIAAGLSYYHYYYEGWGENIAFAASVTAAQVAALALITRRLLFSIAVVACLVAMIVIASDVKRHYFEMVLHAYDIVFYLTSWSTLSFLWVDHKAALLAILASVAATGITASLIYRIDPTRLSRNVSTAALVLFTASALWASNAKGERRNTLFFWDHLYVSSFYSSWSETFETLVKGQLLDAAPSQAAPVFKIPADCDPAEKPPHIILIHQESVVPPSLFPGLQYDRSLDSFFQSLDGRMHRLRVETYGGASWLTEFSVLTGVSTYSFGGMRPFVQSLMQGKVRDTLPQSLARCGYHNSVFYPVPKDFVSNGRFYAAVGMPEIFDYKAQGAKRFNERDAFYYNNALDRLARHVAGSRQPLFTFILTSATHLPYNTPYEPEVKVPGGGPDSDPEMSEYLRRLAMAKMDYDAFRADLARRFPNERFLIIHYGDHQPVATRILLGFDGKLAAEDVKMTPESLGLLTYYRVDAINYEPPPLPDVDTLEVPYLGAVLLHSAGLPLSDANRERMRLMSVCDGRYYTCRDKDQILSFHRRLIDSGLIEAR